jgi:GTP-binding protein EngB required for normal cell division
MDTAYLVGFFTVLICIIASFIIYKAIFRGLNKQRSLLIAGPSNAGKTALFYRLKDDSFRKTVTSMRKNEMSWTNINVIDHPGSLPISSQNGFSSILFLVNPENLKVSAMKLVEVSNDTRSKFIVGIPKTDKFSPEAIVKELKKELDFCKKADLGFIDLAKTETLAFSSKTGEGISKLAERFRK